MAQLKASERHKAMGDSTARHRQFICNMPVPEVRRRCYRGTVIRNVVLVKLKPGQDPAEVADIQDEFRRLNCPGTLSYTIGSDLGLREGNWSFAIVADFADSHAYRAYDVDSAHNRGRARLAPLVEQIARAQFEVPRDPFL